MAKKAKPDGKGASVAAHSETVPHPGLANLKPFQPGQSGNPGGKPLNARNTITKKFLEVLAKDFEANGEAAIVAAREIDPMGYVKAVASLLPKEFIVERPLEQLSDEELVLAISDIRSRLMAAGRMGGAPGSTGAVSAASAATASAASQGDPARDQAMQH